MRASIDSDDSPAVAPNETGTFDRRYLFVGGVVLLAFLAYLRALNNGFVWDDTALILDNRFIGQWSFLWKSLVNSLYWFSPAAHTSEAVRYRPLMSIFFALNYHLFGLNPAGWHAATVAVHLVAVAIAFKLALRLSEDRYVAIVAAILFALIPVNAESVAWISGSPLALAGALELGAFYIFVEREHARSRNWALALALYALALLSHEIAVAFPALIALYVLLLEYPDNAEPEAKGLTSRVARTAEAIAPFAACVLAYLIARRVLFGSFFPKFPGMVTANLTMPTTAEVLLTLPYIILAHLWLLAMPWKAGPAHHAAFVTSATSVRFYAPVAVLILLAASFVAIVRKHPRRRLYLFCAAWVLVAMAPRFYPYALDEAHLIHDSYLYLASFGWCLLVADPLVQFAREGPMRRRSIGVAAIAAVGAIYAVFLWRLEPAWHDSFALFSRSVRGFPDSPYYHFELAQALKKRGDNEGWMREGLLARNLQSPEKEMEIGKLYAAEGNLSEGIVHIVDALNRGARRSADDYMLLAEFYDQTGDTANSETALGVAQSLPGGNKAAGLARAKIAMQHGELQKAESIARDLADRYPDDYRVWTQLGVALSQQNRQEEGLSFLRRAMSLEPEDPTLHVFAARALHELHRDQQALAQCDAALALDPAQADARALAEQVRAGHRAE